MEDLFSNKNTRVLSMHSKFDQKNDVTLFHGDCMNLLKQIPDETAQLVITSPPYNIGKEYEKKEKLNKYLTFQEKVIKESFRILKPSGSICWQVGNFVENGHIVPLDIVLYPIFKKINMLLRNRIIWHFGHGLHASKRLSGRYETIVWFTKTDNYTFNLDSIRTPQKYPNKKHFKGPHKGELSGNPLGKNPSDVWEIPNVKNNHIEKTIHPCQFPVALIERLILALTNKGDLVVDPFIGVGTTSVAALLHNRKSAGADTERKYINIAKKRILLASQGQLKTRKDQPVFDPNHNYENTKEIDKVENLKLSFT